MNIMVPNIISELSDLDPTDIETHILSFCKDVVQRNIANVYCKCNNSDFPKYTMMIRNDTDENWDIKDLCKYCTIHSYIEQTEEWCLEENKNGGIKILNDNNILFFQ